MQEDARPLISVIVAIFNGVKTIQQCIDSVDQQTYSNKELIVIDGRSTDGTLELLTANKDKFSYWISEADGGIYNAWNKGLSQAKGEWICFLGADDYLWDIRVFERMAERLILIPKNIRVAYGQIMMMTDSGEELYLLGEDWNNVKHLFSQIMCVPHPGLMHRRSLFEQHGNFDESFRIAGDYELLLRELKKADAFFIPNLIIAAMRYGGVSSNPSGTIMGLLEARRAQTINGQCYPGFPWISSIARAYLRQVLWKILGEEKARVVLDWGRNIRRLPPHWTKI